MIGDEFKTARMFLLKDLEGNIAWKDPAQAEAQKKRLAARHDAEGVSPEEIAHTDDDQDDGQGEGEEGESNTPVITTM